MNPDAVSLAENWVKWIQNMSNLQNMPHFDSFFRFVIVNFGISKKWGKRVGQNKIIE